ncbi:DUF4199 domain-containing protein [Algoriphagus sp.]|uniref:DUF4199 domain-containing protein n=1 Tax=Algoriphagus sp. TaxID=1872435 RepID=UPI002609C349|nr:DUF4199 domain-containing protein [Algoriphagus sp.]
MNKYFASAYQFGILGGILSILSFGLLAFLQPDPTNLNLVFGYLITPISIFLALKFFKDYTNHGFISFAEGMSVGFVTYMLIALVSGLGIWVILLFSQDLFQVIRESKLSVLVENSQTIIDQLGESSYQNTLENIQEMTAGDVALSDSLWKIIPGLFFTIIISIILRKNPN